MSRSVNVVHLLGNLTKDAETNFTTGGTAVTKFTIVTNFRAKVNGEWEDQADFHNCVAFNADKVAEYMTKGTPVHVTGRLQHRKYEKDGVTKYFTEVVVNNRDIVIVGRAENGNSARPERKKETVDNFDDDVPF